MPLLFLERFPWPSLRTYTALSALALLGTGLSAYRALSQAPGGAQPDGGAAGTELAEPPRRGGPRALDVAYYLLSDSLCVWVSPGPRRGGRRRGLRARPGGRRLSPAACDGAGAGAGRRGLGRAREGSLRWRLKTAPGIKRGLRRGRAGRAPRPARVAGLPQSPAPRGGRPGLALPPSLPPAPRVGPGSAALSGGFCCLVCVLF